VSYTIRKAPDAPAVILTVETRHILEDMRGFDQPLTDLLDAQAERVFLIADLTGLAISLEDLTVGATVIGRSPAARLHHPNVRENLLVTHDGLIKLAAAGLRSATFGSARVRVFETVEQALDYCREQAAVEAGSGQG
jgi:hypothetical protein